MLIIRKIRVKKTGINLCRNDGVGAGSGTIGASGVTGSMGIGFSSDSGEGISGFMISVSK
jgi:hypothetical protein